MLHKLFKKKYSQKTNPQIILSCYYYSVVVVQKFQVLTFHRLPSSHLKKALGPTQSLRLLKVLNHKKTLPVPRLPPCQVTPPPCHQVTLVVGISSSSCWVLIQSLHRLKRRQRMKLRTNSSKKLMHRYGCTCNYVTLVCFNTNRLVCRSTH